MKKKKFKTKSLGKRDEFQVDTRISINKMNEKSFSAGKQINEV